MKAKMMMLILALSFGISTLVAQERRPLSAEERAKAQTERVAERLNLSDEQRERVHAVHMRYARQMPETPAQERRERETEEQREERRAAMERMNLERDRDVKEILTPEQQVRYDELQREMRNRGGNRGPRR